MVENVLLRHSNIMERQNAPRPSGEIGLGGGASAAGADGANPPPPPPLSSPSPTPSDSPCPCPELEMMPPLASDPGPTSSSREASSEVASAVVGVTGPLLWIRPVVAERLH